MHRKERNRIILRTSAGGVLANVLLGLFKIVFGLISGSAAVLTDAVSNFTDALASGVIITGTVFSEKRPNRKHPYGYGRMEYMVTLAIALIVLYAGVEAMRETAEAFLSPHATHYSGVTLTVVIVSIFVKILYGVYTKKKAEPVQSKALHASGAEAIHHALISVLTLAAAVVNILTGLHLEAFASGIIGIFILIEGVHLLRSALSEILGQKVSGELAGKIKATVRSFDGVLGVYDLHLHDYGPDRMLGSVHIEVPDTCTADRLDMLQRKIARKVYREHRVILTGIGIYSMNTGDNQVSRLRKQVAALALAHPHVTGMHGFYLNQESGYASLDLVISFDEKDREGLFDQVSDEIRRTFPQYDFHITMDIEL
ncbi:MAG: cation diffusion facilitator family transporter [Lachnospiraceae bacterium]|jgi:cation diffusion facilitator family transporter|nr:cation diffusion facilitator family transporter [Lachnospiraceae bacterium]MCI1657640.1 cation diffusion facilitator family transporter [Lachnospiraceae bacterium]MCI2196055.1 cation diffusion facilitator family transporter [Lachnospiraceae bacterium]